MPDEFETKAVFIYRCYVRRDLVFYEFIHLRLGKGSFTKNLTYTFEGSVLCREVAHDTYNFQSYVETGDNVVEVRLVPHY